MTEPTHDEIATRAYVLWEFYSTNVPAINESAKYYWYWAENQLRTENAFRHEYNLIHDAAHHVDDRDYFETKPNPLTFVAYVGAIILILCALFTLVWKLYHRTVYTDNSYLHDLAISAHQTSLAGDRWKGQYLSHINNLVKPCVVYDGDYLHCPSVIAHNNAQRKISIDAYENLIFEGDGFDVVHDGNLYPEEPFGKFNQEPR